jgi:hypothetical protein
MMDRSLVAKPKISTANRPVRCPECGELRWRPDRKAVCVGCELEARADRIRFRAAYEQMRARHGE